MEKPEGFRIIVPSFVTLRTDFLFFLLPNFSAHLRSNKLLADQPWLSWLEAAPRRVFTICLKVKHV